MQSENGDLGDHERGLVRVALVRTDHCGGLVDEVTFAPQDPSIDPVGSFQESVYAVHTAVLFST